MKSRFTVRSIINKSLFLGVFVSLSARAQGEPEDVKKNIVPMTRILREARAARQAQVNPFNRADLAQPRDIIGNPRKTRVYTMAPWGLELLNKQAALTPEQFSAEKNFGGDAAGGGGDPQREADANDGDDVTAFEEVGAPLDAAHLSEFYMCKGARTEQGINDANTYWAAALSAIAYLKYPLAFDRLKGMGFEDIVFVEGPSDVEVLVAKIAPKRDAKGNLIKDSGLSIVSFRGTDGVEDWLTDLNATTSNISSHDSEAWLHEGFALALDEVYAEIIKVLDLANNPSPLFVTGHSLGGALATQFVIRTISRDENAPAPLIGSHDDRIRGLYVFAIPRVGNEWARNILDKYMNRTKNVAIAIHSNADPAPKVPFDWLGYKRFGVQAVIPWRYSEKDPDVDYGNKGWWTCHNDVDYKGPSAFSTDLLYSTAEAHYFRSYARHFTPWRNRLKSHTSCGDDVANYGPRFQDENPAAFKPLQTPGSLGLNPCNYTALSWGGNVQL